MTITLKIKIAAVALLVALLSTVGAGWLGYQSARADSSGSAATPSTEAAPADQLHDVVDAPKAAWDDVAAAKRVGWSVAVFAGLVIIARLAARLGRNVKLLAVLGRGKVAVVIGAAGAIGASCYNAAIAGGAWTALLSAALVALGHYVDAESTAK
jgi:hypothetical protein